MSKLPVARFKVVLIGDGMVGKTTIAKRYLGKAFEKEYIRTLGVDFYKKLTEITFNPFGKLMVEWYIWDLGGQYYWSDVRPGYYKGAKGGILVFDVTRPETFINTKYWLKEFITNAGKDLPIVLVGNKIDLREPGKNHVTKEMGEELAKKYSEVLGREVKYYEASAKEGINIEEVFHHMAEEILKYLMEKKRKS